MRVLVWSPILEELPSLGSFLVRADLTLIEADDADQVVERAASDQPQVVVLDEEMPGGGLETVRRLRVHAGVAAVLLRTRRAVRSPLDGVIAVPRGDDAPALLAALTRLLLVPVRAAVRAFMVVEGPRRLSPKPLFEAQSVDISVSGVRIKTPQVLRTGDSCQICFALAPGGPLLLLTARVVRDGGEERGQHLYGLEFKGLREIERDAIRGAVDRMLARADVALPSAV